MTHRPRFAIAPVRRGFTLIELLVVIGIIALLVGILVPVAATIRTRAMGADTKALIRAMSDAADAYYTDFEAYPGILPDSALGPPPVPNPIAFDIDASSGTYAGNGGDLLAGNATGGITGAENFVLSMMGGLRYNGPDIVFDPTRVGSGAVDLAPGGQGQRFGPYLDIARSRLSFGGDGDITGRFSDDNGVARDSEIPEVVDAYNNPLPILYMRVNKRTNNSSAVSDLTGRPSFLLGQVTGYTGPISGAPGPTGVYLGVGRDEVNNFHSINGQFHGLQAGGDGTDTNGFNAASPDGPYDGNFYLTRGGSGQLADVVKDSFVLISAGPDRVYGTRDDITNFGTPLE